MARPRLSASAPVLKGAILLVHTDILGHSGPISSTSTSDRRHHRSRHQGRRRRNSVDRCPRTVAALSPHQRRRGQLDKIPQAVVAREDALPAFAHRARLPGKSSRTFFHAQQNRRPSTSKTSSAKSAATRNRTKSSSWRASRLVGPRYWRSRQWLQLRSGHRSRSRIKGHWFGRAAPSASFSSAAKNKACLVPSPTSKPIAPSSTKFAP